MDTIVYGADEKTRDDWHISLRSDVEGEQFAV